MCLGCWHEKGSPSIINEKTKACALLVAKIYDHSSVGGNAHIVVDDWNLRDSDLAFCLNAVEQDERTNEENLPEQWAAERACLLAMQDMTEDERYSALAINEGAIPVLTTPTPSERGRE